MIFFLEAHEPELMLEDERLDDLRLQSLQP